MVLPKARKVNKNHKNTVIHFNQQTEIKKDKKHAELEKAKWSEQKKVKPFTIREFSEKIIF